MTDWDEPADDGVAEGYLGGDPNETAADMAVARAYAQAKHDAYDNRVLTCQFCGRSVHNRDAYTAQADAFVQCKPCARIEQEAMEATAQESLSLIHISEPTRPY